MSLEGKTALVTGAARGIGLAIAQRLAADGARVAVLDSDRAGAEAAAKALGPPALPLVADVTRSAEVDRAVGEVVARWRRLDVLVNNAGITGRSFPLWELTDEDWQRVIDVDLSSVFYCSRAAVKVMLDQGSGRIVNIASIAGKEREPDARALLLREGGGDQAHQGAWPRKWPPAASSSMRWRPAVIGTELLKQMERSTVDLLVSKIPMGRVGRPEEVAALVAWLASDECSFSTGAVYDLSGGRATY